MATSNRSARWTIFRTPILRQVLGWVSTVLLWAFRWKTIVVLPDAPKVVLVVAPHTSYWDLPVGLAAALKHGIDAHWLGTHRLFRGPGGPLFRWLGGIPVDRTRRNGLVASVVEALDADEHVMLAVAPEGTRFLRDHWKTGFYRIALGAGVPLWLASLDYGTRTVRADTLLSLTGEAATDFARIGEFYAGVRAKNPGWFTPPTG